METVDLHISSIQVPEGNPNEMDDAMQARLRRSIERFGCQAPLVVRQIGPGCWETVGGAQRLGVLRAMGEATAPCVVVVADDAEARLLGQALNHIVGQDNDGLRGELLRQLLEALPQEEVQAILPDSARSLEALTSLGQEDMAAHLRAWEQAQGARLRHLTFQLQEEELAVVQQALGQAVGLLTEPGENPNRRGQALAGICRSYLKNLEKEAIV